MGSDLRLVLPLLRTLNLSPGLRLNYQVLCSSLAISVLELQETASLINEIEPLLVQEGEDLVLTKKLDLLDGKEIQAQVNVRGRFALKNVTTSTNAELIDELGQEEGLLSGDTLVAEIQTQGRSRRGTKWLTSIGTNLMVSLAFRFPSLQHLLGFSLAIGVATVTALEQLGVRDLKLKWPNDVLIDERKVCGILCEAQTSAKGIEGIVVGIGVNTGVVPEALAHRAVGLGGVDRLVLLTELCAAFETLYARWSKGGLPALRAELDALDCKRGKTILMRPAGGTIEGLSRGIRDDGALLLDREGTIEPILCGEIAQWD